MSASGGDRAKRPTLVFLHGIQPVGQQRTEGWSETLQSAWDALDLPWSINDVELIEPRYNDLFVGPASEDFDKPTRYAGDKDPGGRRDYEASVSRLRTRCSGTLPNFRSPQTSVAWPAGMPSLRAFDGRCSSGSWPRSTGARLLSSSRTRWGQ